MKTLIGALRSKTIWANVILAAGAALIESLSAAGLPATTYALIVAAVNAGLRAITTTSLADKVKAKA